MSTSLKSSLGEKFIVTITNGSASDVVLALLAAYFDTHDQTGATAKQHDPAEIVRAGFACDAVIDDGDIIGAGATAVKATSANSKMTIRAFREYLKHNSRVVKAMSVQASNVAAFNTTMEIVTVSPLTGSQPQYMPLAALRDRYTTLSDVIDVDTSGLVLGFDKLVLLPVAAGHQVTITFWF